MSLRSEKTSLENEEIFGERIFAEVGDFLEEFYLEIKQEISFGKNKSEKRQRSQAESSLNLYKEEKIKNAIQSLNKNLKSVLLKKQIF